MLEFKTIRQTAATGLITEHHLRQLVKQGLVPGIQVGNRFLINVPALAEKLDKMSRTEKIDDTLKTEQNLLEGKIDQ